MTVSEKTVREVEIVSDIATVSASQWHDCVGTSDPFVSHAFLLALEQSGSATAETGWLPQHIVVRGVDGTIDAVAPVYLKGHSYGEYVFDWSWASAFERAGGRYYPKLQCCVPFTPVTGPRLMVREGCERDTLQRVMVAAMRRLVERLELSGAHVSFLTSDEQALFVEGGFAPRRGIQYHWHNHGYGCFDDFAASFVSRKRKVMNRERREAQQCGLTLRTLTGEAIEARHWEAFFGFYRDTTARKWAEPYLREAFFRQIGDTMADRIVLMLAEDRGEPVAGALHFLGEEALYGRYWGAKADLPFVHFELCYYRAIEMAIERGLDRVEAGAQGEHKVRRGYLPQWTYSAHRLEHEGFFGLIAEALERESEVLEGHREELMAASPFRKPSGC